MFYPLFYIADRSLLPEDLSSEVIAHLQTIGPPQLMPPGQPPPKNSGSSSSSSSTSSAGKDSSSNSSSFGSGALIDPNELANDLVVISREQIDDSIPKDTKKRGGAGAAGSGAGGGGGAGGGATGGGGQRTGAAGAAKGLASPSKIDHRKVCEHDILSFVSRYCACLFDRMHMCYCKYGFVFLAFIRVCAEARILDGTRR